MNERRNVGARARFGGCLLGAVVAGAPTLFPSVAAAGFSATVETTFARSRSTLEGQGDATTESDTSTILGRLYLAYLGNLYPYVTLRVGGTADQSLSSSTSDGSEVDSAATRVNPYLDLSFNNPVVHGGIGYNRRQEWQRTDGSSSPSLVRESAQGLLGFKPEGLPTLDLQVLRTDTFDTAREQSDQRVDHVAWSSRYQPIPGLDLSYQGTHNRTEDRLRDLEVIDLTNSGRASYGSRFLSGRVNLNTSYGLTRQDTDTRVRAGGEGEVSSPLFPFGGLASVDASPEAGALDASRALVDGDVTASSGINLGTPPIGGDATPRNLGLDLGGASDVNTLRVWVDRAVPPVVAASLSWSVYVSADNQTWQRHQTIAAAPFGPFENRFEIRFAPARARFVKVAVSPLSPTVPGALDVPTLLVTELQPFLTVPAQQVRGTATRTSQLYDLGVRALLLQGPALSYDFYYLRAVTTPEKSVRQTVTNGLSAARRFGPIASGTARLSREDSIEPQRRASAWSYSASLSATPLETLSHTLVVSGRMEDADGETSRTESLFLNNAAALYPGIDVSLAGGVSRKTSGDGERGTSATLNAGATLVPNPQMAVNLSYADSVSDPGGDAVDGSKKRSQRGDASLSFSPVSTLYLFVSLGVLRETDRPTSRTQSYSVGWSPFRDGALQFSVSFAESLRSEDNGRDRFLTPSLRWNLGRSATLDVSYQRAESESASQNSKTETYSANLRASF